MVNWCRNNRSVTGLPRLDAVAGRKAAKSTSGQWDVLCRALTNEKAVLTARLSDILQTADKLARVLNLSKCETAFLSIVIGMNRLGSA